MLAIYGQKDLKMTIMFWGKVQKKYWNIAICCLVFCFMLAQQLKLRTLKRKGRPNESFFGLPICPSFWRGQSSYLRRPQNFAKSPLHKCKSNLHWRFCKTLWPFRNIWTLKYCRITSGFLLFFPSPMVSLKVLLRV